MKWIHFMDTNKKLFVFYKTKTYWFSIVSTCFNSSIFKTVNRPSNTVVNYPETSSKLPWDWSRLASGTWWFWRSGSSSLVALSLLYSRVLTFLPSPKDRDTEPIGAPSHVRKRLAILKSFPIPKHIQSLEFYALHRTTHMYRSSKRKVMKG